MKKETQKTKKENPKFERNDYQGRSVEQLESSMKSFAICFVALTILVIIALLFS